MHKFYLFFSIRAARDKLGRRLRRFFWTPVGRNSHRVQKRHEFPQTSSHLFDGMSLLTLAGGVKPRTSGFVFRDPLASIFTALNFAKHAPHGVSRFVRDQLWAASVIAMFGRVADGIAHVVQAPAVHQIHNQLQFMHALEISDLRLVTRLDESFEAGLD